MTKLAVLLLNQKEKRRKISIKLFALKILFTVTSLKFFFLLV